MLENILKLNGAQQLSKNEQNAINGGYSGCHSACNTCIANQCVLLNQ